MPVWRRYETLRLEYPAEWAERDRAGVAQAQAEGAQRFNEDLAESLDEALAERLGEDGEDGASAAPRSSASPTGGQAEGDGEAAAEGAAFSLMCGECE